LYSPKAQRKVKGWYEISENASTVTGLVLEPLIEISTSMAGVVRLLANVVAGSNATTDLLQGRHHDTTQALVGKVQMAF
jgi:hypothetical protein